MSEMTGALPGPEKEQVPATTFYCYQCDHCNRHFLTIEELTLKLCPVCSKGSLNTTGTACNPAIESILPPRLSRDDLQKRYIDFINRLWLADPELTPTTLLAHARNSFFPMWLVDCTVQGIWDAEMGFDYQVKSSREHFAGSSWQSEEVVEEKIRWEKRLGTIAKAYQNHATPALTDHQARLEKLGEYDFSPAIAFSPNQLANSIIEQPDVSTETAWVASRQQIDNSAATDCQAASDAQHIRNFKITAGYHNQKWTNLLLPLVSSWYQDEKGNVHLVLINSQSGHIHGKRLASQKKGNKQAVIIFLVALGILLLSGIATMVVQWIPSIRGVSGVLTALSVLIAAGALIPLIWPWYWNNKQKEQP